MNTISLKHRFVIFSFQEYYPCGGLTDADDYADTYEEAIEKAQELFSESICTVQVLDMDTRQYFEFKQS